MASRQLVEICITFPIYQHVNNLHIPTYSCSVQIIIFDFLNFRQNGALDCSQIN